MEYYDCFGTTPLLQNMSRVFDFSLVTSPPGLGRLEFYMLIVPTLRSQIDTGSIDDNPALPVLRVDLDQTNVGFLRNVMPGPHPAAY